MSYQPLHNYLRTARRRSGLTQEEIALLLGTRSGAKVSRYEAFARVPSISTVFAFEIIFRKEVRDLFAGTYDQVRRATLRRTKRLMKKLREKKQRPAELRKIEFLHAIVEGEK